MKITSKSKMRKGKKVIGNHPLNVWICFSLCSCVWVSMSVCVVLVSLSLVLYVCGIFLGSVSVSVYFLVLYACL